MPKPKIPADVKRMDRSSALEKAHRKRRDFYKAQYAAARNKQEQAAAAAKMDYFTAKIAMEQARRKIIQVKHW